VGIEVRVAVGDVGDWRLEIGDWGGGAVEGGVCWLQAARSTMEISERMLILVSINGQTGVMDERETGLLLGMAAADKNG
jgi:hypothetical protein